MATIRRKQRPLIRALATVTSAALLASGCVAPFQFDALFKLPDSYREADVAEQKKETLSASELAVWWEQFHDPVLSQLITETLTRNNDLKIAATRVEQARAVELGARSLLLPTVGLGAQARRFSGGETESILLNELGINNFTANYWQTGLQAGWELDLFGAGRARLAAAQEQRKASLADVQAVRLSLTATVASLYSSYRGLQQQQLVLLDSLKEAREFLDIAERSFTAGVVLSTDVNLARAGVAQVEARLQKVDAGLAQIKLNLENLSMLPPGSLNALLAEPKPIPQIEATISPGQPVELLMRRPDLISAEARFKATLKQGEAARLDYLPKFSLAGLLGRSGMEIGNVSSAGSLWLVNLIMSVPLIDFGARQSQVEIADARSREALLAYEKFALAALFDVERALAQLGREKQQQQAIQNEIDERNIVLQKTARQYELGDAGRLEMAQARVALLDSRAALVTQQVSQLQTQISLFLAMGGGWNIGGETAEPAIGTAPANTSTTPATPE
ncbi:MAG: efflux transporter outer membrane subunit [Azovibrio sp.]